ncbi:Fc.00g085040.m01.CDS01 [Cosmosporella sp. VM-42]
MASSSSKGSGHSRSERVWPFFRKRPSAEASIRDLLKEEHGDLLKEFERLLEDRRANDSPAASIASDPPRVPDSLSTQSDLTVEVTKRESETLASWRTNNYSSSSTQTEPEVPSIPEILERAVQTPVYLLDDADASDSEQQIGWEDDDDALEEQERLEQSPPQLGLMEIRPFEELNSTASIRSTTGSEVPQLQVIPVQPFDELNSTAPIVSDAEFKTPELQVIPVQPFDELNTTMSIHLPARDYYPRLQLTHIRPFEEFNIITSTTPPSGLQDSEQQETWTPEGSPDREVFEQPTKRRRRRIGGITFVPWKENKWIRINLPQPAAYNPPPRPKYPRLKWNIVPGKKPSTIPEVDPPLPGETGIFAQKNLPKLPEVDRTKFLGLTYKIGASNQSNEAGKGSTRKGTSLLDFNAEELVALGLEDMIQESGSSKDKVFISNFAKPASYAGPKFEFKPKEPIPKLNKSPKFGFSSSNGLPKFNFDLPNEPLKFDFETKPFKPDPNKFQFSTTPSHPTSTEGLKFDFSKAPSNPKPTKEPKLDFNTVPTKPTFNDGLKFNFSTKPSNPKPKEGLRFDFSPKPSNPEPTDEPKLDSKPTPSKPNSNENQKKSDFSNEPSNPESSKGSKFNFNTMPKPEFNERLDTDSSTKPSDNGPTKRSKPT